MNQNNIKEQDHKVNIKAIDDVDESSDLPRYYRPQFAFPNGDTDGKRNAKLWGLMNTYLPQDIENLQKHIVCHVEYNLARTRFNMDNNVCYQAVAYSIRDRLIESSNDTRKHTIAINPKRAYYFSIEYLPGRSLKNSLINLNLEDQYRKALEELGYDLEELYGEEHDPGLGNGGLGRLASCFLDSLATLDYPVWGYGLRYNYGMFKQKILKDGQCEVPDYWLVEGYPWEVRRSDVGYQVRFYGKVKREKVDGKEKVIWDDGDAVHAIAYDCLIPGFNTHNTVTLRLWKSEPTKEFDFALFNHGDYFQALQDKQKAEFISSILYPNENFPDGKELRLKQQYFFVSASCQDILRRFKVTNDKWDLLPEKVAIQLNDTHPTFGILEMLRLLIDQEDQEIEYAWGLVQRIFSYTNHTVLPEALEKWEIDVLERLLPRHLELIHWINEKFLDEVDKKFPGDTEKRRAMSLIEEDKVKKVRMYSLAIVGSHTVNGVAEVHTNILKTEIFKDFKDLYPNKFQNKTNGITHRRWIACANPGLAKLYTEELKSRDWLVNLSLVKQLLNKLDDAEFRERWNDIKQKNKKKLLDWVEKKTGVTLREDSMFDVMIKRIHEYKRQLMNALHVVYRYLQLKKASPEEREKFVRRSVLIGGKAAPGYKNAKLIIKLIVRIAQVVNDDPDTNEYLKLVFLPNYNVSNAETIIPGADINQNISTAGTEASGTSNMKFCMNGAILLGTMDGANIEICQEIGKENMIAFGVGIDEVSEVQTKVMTGKVGSHDYTEINETLDAITKGTFGDDEEINELIEGIKGKDDFYLICYDFKSYIEAQYKMDEWFKDREEWTKKSIITALNCSKFSSDRTVKEYAEQIWKIEPTMVPKPTTNTLEICKVICHVNKVKEEVDHNNKPKKYKQCSQAKENGAKHKSGVEAKKN